MSNNRGHHSKSPSSGRFIVNFNGIEKKIVLKQSKGDYTVDRMKSKVFGKFKKLGTTDFHIKMKNGSSINSDGDIILSLLGQNEPFPQCSVFVGIPRFDIDRESLSQGDDDDAISPLPPSNECHRRLNHNISNLMELKSIVTKHDIYQGHREYICRFNNVLMKMILTMFDIAKYSQNAFKHKFLSLFEYKLCDNESLQFRVYHISTEQYIAIKLPLWSYDSEHYHIEGEIEVAIEEEREREEEREQEREEYDEQEADSISIHDFEDVLDALNSDLKSQQKEFEEIISNMNISINEEISIYLWKKYKFKLKEIERNITSFIKKYEMRLNEDLAHHLSTKYMKLKEICDSSLKTMNGLQRDIDCNESEIVNLEKAIRRLTLQNHSKQIEMKREENIWNLAQKKLKKLRHFEGKYVDIKSALNCDITSFESKEKIAIYDLRQHLNHIWKRFELNYLQWDQDTAIQWILCIENFYFSNDKFGAFIETLKTHRFVGKNLKELRATFTLNVMALKDGNDQHILIKNINRIMNQSAIPSSSTTGNLCCICAENEINTVIIPCGHMVYCSNCTKKLTIDVCPTCRGKDVKVMITYKSGL